MKCVLTGVALLLAMQALFAQEPVADDQQIWVAINKAVTSTFVLPAYAAFADATADLPAAAKALCAQTDAQHLDAMQLAYASAVDGWQQIQHIQFGPITYFNWNYRLQYWPDDKNSGSRQISAMLQAKETAALSEEEFPTQSVGVQGFPALERLLYEDSALQLLQQDNFRCQLLQTIASNIQQMAIGVNAQWQNDFHTTITNADDRSYFESAQDATIEYFKALEETVRKNQQQKLEAVLGDGVDSVRIRRAESWRSKRSLRNLKLNFEALASMYEAGEPAMGAALQATDQELVKAAFRKVNLSLADLPDSYALQLEKVDGYTALSALRDDVDALFETMETALKNTDMYLGFNSLDGD